jgi:hypothetical protein
MYSGSTFTSISGHFLGTHQKIDRISRKHLERLAPACRFPSVRAILHFEGDNGPDAIKRKSPAKDEPWHYLQPFDNKDTQLLHLIADHYKKLVVALEKGDDVRSAFEAAWLAHAIVDGLTPAHHYPYEEKLIELRGGEGIHTRTTIKHKLLMPGTTRGKQVHNNWKMWGPKGLFTTHVAFEWGVATIIKPLRFTHAFPNATELQTINSENIADWFRQIAQTVAKTGIYDEFYRNGWTAKLTRQIRQDLAPTLVRAVTVVWYGAAREANVMEASKT